MKISIIGLGRFGEALGEVLLKDGHSINGTTRTENKLNHLKARELNPSLLNYPDSPDFILDSDIIILNIPPFDLQLEWFKSWKWRERSKLIFISSTSVYPTPNSSSAEILKVQEEWIKSTFPIYSILRFGGLYSDSFHPGRYLSGKQNLPGRLWPVNLVHLKDAVGFTKVVIDRGLYSRTFQVICNEHPTREKYYTDFCLKEGLPIPQFDPGDLTTKQAVPSEEVSTIYKFTPL
jgi:nucleoside-diphosphate-sugar epimerase